MLGPRRRRFIAVFLLSLPLLILSPVVSPGGSASLSAQSTPEDPRLRNADPVMAAALRKLQPEPGRRYRVDIITMTPLEAIYGIWGHSSLRIYDRKLRRDIIFDWGVFQFDGTFLIRFLKGSPAYLLAASPLMYNLQFHARTGRSGYTQQLLLDDAQAAKLFRALAINSQPANRTYIYHHYNNNCVTKIRDIADAASDGTIKAMFAGQPANKTFRQTSNDYALNVIHWLAINLIQGTTTDVPVTAWQEMYLPINFMNYLEEYRAARIKAGEESIIGEKVEIISGKPAATESGWTGALVLTILLVAFFFVAPAALPGKAWLVRTGKIARRIWHGLAGFTGVVLAVFWLFTGHDSMINNLNLLAFSPLLLFTPLINRLLKNQPGRLAQVYLFFASLPVLGIIFMLTGLSVQPAWAFMLPSAVIQICVYFSVRHETSKGETSSGASE